MDPQGFRLRDFEVQGLGLGVLGFRVYVFKASEYKVRGLGGGGRVAGFGGLRLWGCMYPRHPSLDVGEIHYEQQV